MVRVRLRYADLETFIERFAPNVTRGGIFLASRTPRPEGDVFTFEVQLATGAVALAGEGKVIWVKPFNPAEPQKPHGMGVQFVRLEPASREILTRILQAKGTATGAMTTGSGPRSIAGQRRGSQPHATLHGGTNGVARARVDTSVDLAAEYGIDEGELRRIIDRNWTLGARGDDEIQDLLKPDTTPPATLAQALADLPRLLNPATRRRTGAFRVLETLAPVEKPAAAAAPVAPDPASPAADTTDAAADTTDARDPNEITFQDDADKVASGK